MNHKALLTLENAIAWQRSNNKAAFCSDLVRGTKSHLEYLSQQTTFLQKGFEEVLSCRFTDSSPSQIAKDCGCKSVAEVSRITLTPQRTLFDMAASNPKRYRAVCLGAGLMSQEIGL